MTEGGNSRKTEPDGQKMAMTQGRSPWLFLGALVLWSLSGVGVVAFVILPAFGLAEVPSIPLLIQFIVFLGFSGFWTVLWRRAHSSLPG